MRARQGVVVLAGSIVLALAVPAAASAQEEPEPPVAECGFLSAVVCQLPVTVGPFYISPVLNFPNGLFGPPPTLPPVS